MKTVPQNFICLATGNFYGKAEIYIDKLYSMLTKHMKENFILTCITDEKRKINPKIKQIDCSNWNELKVDGMRATTIKLGLFNPEYIPIESFIYLDLTLIINSDLTPIIDFVESRNEPLIIVKDWHYETCNSCLMKINNKELGIIYDDFVSGIRYNQKVKGDQEFIYNTIKKHHLHEKFSYFPEEFVVSFKQLTRQARRCNIQANEKLKKSIIVKFHGKPKVHEFVNPIYRFIKYNIGNMRYGKLGPGLDFKKLVSNWK